MFLCKILPLYNKSFNILLFFSHRIHISEYILITKWKGDFMNYFIIFIIILTIMLIAVSLLINPLMGIFIASTVSCLWLNMINKDKDKDKMEL